VLHNNKRYGEHVQSDTKI